MRTLIGSALLLATTLTGGARAQEHADFGRLEPGQTVRVKTVGGSRFSTRLGLRDGDSLPLLFAHARIPFEAARVDSLWVQGHATVTGMIVGAAIAAPVTFGLMALTCEALSEGECGDYGIVTLLGLGGGAAGALIGGAIGWLIPKWRLRYARAEAITIRPMVGRRLAGFAIEF